MASGKLLHGQITEFGDTHKAMIADALQAAVNDMPTKHQSTPTASDSNDADKYFNATKSHNSTAPIRVAKNIFTNGTEFPILGHLLADISELGSFVTFTDMTQGALQVQEFNIDPLRDVDAVKELEEVQESELVDVKLEIDFDEEFANLPENVETNAKTNTYFNLDYKTEFEPNIFAETSPTPTQHKAIGNAQIINKNDLRDTHILQEFRNVQETELVDVKIEHQIDIDSEFVIEGEPNMVSTTSHTSIQHKDIDELVDFEAELSKLSNPVILKVKEEAETIENMITNIPEDYDDDDAILPTAAKKLKYYMASKPTKNESFFLFICPECNYHAKSYDDWKDHTNVQHLFNTVEKINMQSVKSTSNAKFGFKCRRCSAPYWIALNCSEEVITHHIIHLPFKRHIKCRLCDQSFSVLGIAKRHLRLIHPEHYCIEQIKMHKKQPNPLDYVSLHCPTCNKEQANRDRWTEHLTLQHNFFVKCKEQFRHIVGNQYECKVCLMRCRENAFSDHSLTHEPYQLFQCTLCPVECKFTTVTKRAALYHVRHEHLMIQDYVNCNLCDASFITAKALKCHISGYHNRCYGSCQACNMEFANIKQLVTHMQSDRHNENSK